MNLEFRSSALKKYPVRYPNGRETRDREIDIMVMEVLLFHHRNLLNIKKE